MELLLLPLGLVTYFTPMLSTLNIAAVSGCLLALTFKKRWLTVLILTLIISQILVTAITESGKINQELNTKLGTSFTTDQRAFIKTRQLMAEGVPYYQSFQQAMSLVMRADFKPDIGGWRQPLFFQIWNLLPQGIGIYVLWVAISVITFIAVFFINPANEISPKALIPPLILFPYWHFSLSDLTFLQVEWWGASFFIMGLAALSKKKPLLSGVLFAISLSFRELFFLPILLIVALNFNKKIVLPILFFWVYYFALYLPEILPYVSRATRTLGFGSSTPLLSTLAYGTWGYLFWIIRPILFLLALSVFIFTILVVKKRVNSWHLTVISSFIPFVILTTVLSFIGGIDSWHDYWGIYFSPALLATLPSLISPPGK